MAVSVIDSGGSPARICYKSVQPRRLYTRTGHLTGHISAQESPVDDIDTLKPPHLSV